ETGENGGGAVMAGRTRTRISSEPSKRTSAPRWATRPASSGEWRNIEKGPRSVPRLLTMASTIAWSLAGTWSLLVIGVSLAMVCLRRVSSFIRWHPADDLRRVVDMVGFLRDSRRARTGP